MYIGHKQIHKHNSITMEKAAFLEAHVFTDLKKIENKSTQEDIHLFSETDFQTILERVEHFGIGIFTITSWLDGKAHGVCTHEEFKRKTTDSKWYKKAFLTFKTATPAMSYTATYKVSARLLAR